MGDQQGGYPAGWYPLPDGVRERYWDGATWTDAVRPLGGPAVPPPPSGGPLPTAAQVYGTPAPHHGPAIASMVLGIVSWSVCPVGPVTSIIGLVLGITSLRSVQPRGPKRGRGMAIAGIVLSAAFIALLALGIMLAIVGNNTFD